MDVLPASAAARSERARVVVALSYSSLRAGFESITGHLSISPGKVDLCTVDGEPVMPQEFY